MEEKDEQEQQYANIEKEKQLKEKNDWNNENLNNLDIQTILLKNEKIEEIDISNSSIKQNQDDKNNLLKKKKEKENLLKLSSFGIIYTALNDWCTHSTIDFIYNKLENKVLSDKKENKKKEFFMPNLSPTFLRKQILSEMISIQ